MIKSFLDIFGARSLTAATAWDDSSAGVLPSHPARFETALRAWSAVALPFPGPFFVVNQGFCGPAAAVPAWSEQLMLLATHPVRMTYVDPDRTYADAQILVKHLTPVE